MQTLTKKSNAIATDSPVQMEALPVASIPVAAGPIQTRQAPMPRLGEVVYRGDIVAAVLLFGGFAFLDLMVIYDTVAGLIRIW